MDSLLVSDVRTRFTQLYPGAPPGIALAPGRVNLIGEHTDYNDGYVLPMAIERGVAVAFRTRDDRMIRAHSCAFGETREVAMEELVPPRGRRDWLAYVAGVAWALEAAGSRLCGLDMAIGADVPIGAGLSSSAALEVAVARAFCAAAGLPWEPLEMATLCRKAENEFVGMGCGIMDQLASIAGQEGSALLVDCRSLHTEVVPVPDSVAFVVMDTGVRRSLTTSAYNDRRAACESAVETLRAIDPRVRALRDVDRTLLHSARGRMDPVIFRRASHVVAENPRPLAMAAALRGGQLAAAGRLMNESHASLRDLYEVSCPELDLMASLAQSHPACHGARMTGAGFGGCAVALVDSAGAVEFEQDVRARYEERTGLPASFFSGRPGAGARLAG